MSCQKIKEKHLAVKIFDNDEVNGNIITNGKGYIYTKNMLEFVKLSNTRSIYKIFFKKYIPTSNIIHGKNIFFYGSNNDIIVYELSFYRIIKTIKLPIKGNICLIKAFSFDNNLVNNEINNFQNPLIIGTTIGELAIVNLDLNIQKQQIIKIKSLINNQITSIAVISELSCFIVGYQSGEIESCSLMKLSNMKVKKMGEKSRRSSIMESSFGKIKFVESFILGEFCFIIMKGRENELNIMKIKSVITTNDHELEISMIKENKFFDKNLFYFLSCFKIKVLNEKTKFHRTQYIGFILKDIFTNNLIVKIFHINYFQNYLTLKKSQLAKYTSIFPIEFLYFVKKKDEKILKVFIQDNDVLYDRDTGKLMFRFQILTQYKIVTILLQNEVQLFFSKIVEENSNIFNSNLIYRFFNKARQFELIHIDDEEDDDIEDEQIFTEIFTLLFSNDLSYIIRDFINNSKQLNLGLIFNWITNIHSALLNDENLTLILQNCFAEKEEDDDDHSTQRELDDYVSYINEEILFPFQELFKILTCFLNRINNYQDSIARENEVQIKKFKKLLFKNIESFKVMTFFIKENFLNFPLNFSAIQRPIREYEYGINVDEFMKKIETKKKIFQDSYFLKKIMVLYDFDVSFYPPNSIKDIFKFFNKENEEDIENEDDIFNNKHLILLYFFSDMQHYFPDNFNKNILINYLNFFEISKDYQSYLFLLWKLDNETDFRNINEKDFSTSIPLIYVKDDILECFLTQNSNGISKAKIFYDIKGCGNPFLESQVLLENELFEKAFFSQRKISNIDDKRLCFCNILEKMFKNNLASDFFKFFLNKFEEKCTIKYLKYSNNSTNNKNLQDNWDLLIGYLISRSRFIEALQLLNSIKENENRKILKITIKKNLPESFLGIEHLNSIIPSSFVELLSINSTLISSIRKKEEEADKMEIVEVNGEIDVPLTIKNSIRKLAKSLCYPTRNKETVKECFSYSEVKKINRRKRKPEFDIQQYENPIKKLKLDSLSNEEEEEEEEEEGESEEEEEDESEEEEDGDVKMRDKSNYYYYGNRYPTSTVSNNNQVKQKGTYDQPITLSSSDED